MLEDEMSELSRLSTESAVAGSHHVSPQPDYTHLPPEQYARLPLQSDYAGSGGNGGNGDVPLPPPSATTTAPYDDIDDADSYPEKSVLKQMEDYEKDQQRRVTQSDVINPPSRAELQDALREANYLRLVVERQRALLDGAEAAAKDTAVVHEQEKQELRQEIEHMGRKTVEKFKKMAENHAVLMAQMEVEAGRLREKNEWLMRMLDMDAAAKGYASGKPHVSPDAPGRQPDLHMPSMHAGEEEYVPERQHVPPDASRGQSSSHSRQHSSSNLSSSTPQQPMNSNNTNSDFPAMSTEQMKELSRASMMTQRPALSTAQLKELSREYSTMTQRPRPPNEEEIWEQWPPEVQPERSTMRSIPAGKQRSKSQPPRDELKQPETQPKRRTIKNPPPTTSKKKKKEEYAEPLGEEEWAEPLEKEEWKVPIVAASSSESDSEYSGFDSDSSSEESAPKERVPVRSSKKNEKEKQKTGRRKPPISDSDSDSDSDSSLGSDESSPPRKGRKEKPNPSGGKGVLNRAFARKLSTKSKSGSSVVSAPTKKKSSSSSVELTPLSTKRKPFSRLMPGRSKSVTKSTSTVPSSKSKKASGGSGSVARKGSSRKTRASSRSDSSSSSARRKPSVKTKPFSRLMNRGKSVTKLRPPPSPSSKSRKERGNDSPPRTNRSSRKMRASSRSPGRDRGNQKQRNTDKKRNKNKG